MIYRLIIQPFIAELSDAQKAILIAEVVGYVEEQQKLREKPAMIYTIEDLQDIGTAMEEKDNLYPIHHGDLQIALDHIKMIDKEEFIIFLIDSYYTTELPNSVLPVNRSVTFLLSDNDTIQSNEKRAVLVGTEKAKTNAEDIFLHHKLNGLRPDLLNISAIESQFDIIQTDYDELTDSVEIYNALVSMPEEQRNETWLVHFKDQYIQAYWADLFIEQYQWNTWWEVTQSLYARIRKATCEVEIGISGLRLQLGLTPDGDLAEIIKSNWTKFCRTEEECRNTIAKYEAIGIELESTFNNTDREDLTKGITSFRFSRTQENGDQLFIKGKQAIPPSYVFPDLNGVPCRVYLDEVIAVNEKVVEPQTEVVE